MIQSNPFNSLPKKKGKERKKPICGENCHIFRAIFMKCVGKKLFLSDFDQNVDQTPTLIIPNLCSI